MMLRDNFALERTETNNSGVLGARGCFLLRFYLHAYIVTQLIHSDRQPDRGVYVHFCEKHRIGSGSVRSCRGRTTGRKKSLQSSVDSRPIRLMRRENRDPTANKTTKRCIGVGEELIFGHKNPVVSEVLRGNTSSRFHISQASKQTSKRTSEWNTVVCVFPQKLVSFNGKSCKVQKINKLKTQTKCKRNHASNNVFTVVVGRTV